LPTEKPFLWSTQYQQSSRDLASAHFCASIPFSRPRVE
jgi:hypothetical protein